MEAMKEAAGAKSGGLSGQARVPSGFDGIGAAAIFLGRNDHQSHLFPDGPRQKPLRFWDKLEGFRRREAARLGKPFVPTRWEDCKPLPARLRGMSLADVLLGKDGQ
jgi:hypothetical protein